MKLPEEVRSTLVGFESTIATSRDEAIVCDCAKVAHKEWRRLKAHGWEGDAFLARQVYEAILARYGLTKRSGE